LGVWHEFLTLLHSDQNVSEYAKWPEKFDAENGDTPRSPFYGGFDTIGRDVGTRRKARGA
jgi:hypothetical protein